MRRRLRGLDRGGSCRCMDIFPNDAAVKQLVRAILLE
jgi:hypothetical protein